MKRKLAFSCATLVLVASSITYRAETASISNAALPSAPEQVVTVPLFLLRNEARARFHFYTIDPNEKNILDQQQEWNYQGITCYVIPNSKKPPGSVEMYRLTKQMTDDINIFHQSSTHSKFFYTTDKAEADNAANNLGWRLEGVPFYVSPKPAAGSAPLYRLYAPLNESKSSGGTFLYGDSFVYTTSEKTKADYISYGYQFQRIEGYVWNTQVTLDTNNGLAVFGATPAPALTKPDLVVFKTIADQTSVTALIRNQGGTNTGGVKYQVSLLIYDRQNHLETRLVQNGPGLSPDQIMPVKFDTSVKRVAGKNYQIVIDEQNTLTTESEKKNNATEILSGPVTKIATPSDTGEKLTISFGASLVNKQDITASSGQFSGKNTIYSLKLSNVDDFPKDWFKSLTVLDQVKCGALTNARLIAEVKWKYSAENAGQWKTGSCKPLKSPQDLDHLELSVSENKFVPDQLMVVITDRLTNIQHKSNLVPVGAYGVSEVLYPLDCFGLVGRVDDFVCKTKLGLTACENLQAKGKPIKCRMGK
jgi:uncharacterized protein DUF5648